MRMELTGGLETVTGGQSTLRNITEDGRFKQILFL